MFDLEFSLTQGAFVLEMRARIEGRALALFGPSGSGKTTVVEAIAGLRAPQRGRIVVNGVVFADTVHGVSLPPRRRRVGYVPQDALLFPHMSVRRNIDYGRQPDAPVLDRLTDLLELDGLLDRDVRSLSGGERQRVAIARALASAPDVLLLDEPLAAVDLSRRRRIAGALARIREELPVLMVYVTHAPDEAIGMADHAVVLDGGRVVASGRPSEVLSERI